MRLAAPGAASGPGAPGRDACAVVIDVLRATTTLTFALLRDAGSVAPLLEPEEALAMQRTDGALACGERDGRIVPGFDLGNSPFEYTEERVRGRRLAFASTNGAVAMLWARAARRRVLAAFVNLSAVADRVHHESHVVIVCAGKLGRFALEDAACAGLLVERLVSAGASAEGPAARLARSLAPRSADEVRGIVEGCSHGRYLRRLGPAFARDVAFCGELDSVGTAFDV